MMKDRNVPMHNTLQRATLATILGLSLVVMPVGGSRDAFAAVPCTDAAANVSLLTQIEQGWAELGIQGAVQALVEAGNQFMQNQLTKMESNDKAAAKAGLAAQEIQTNVEVAIGQSIVDGALQNEMEGGAIKLATDALPPPTSIRACAMMIQKANIRGQSGFSKGVGATMGSSISLMNKGQTARGNGPLYISTANQTRCGGPGGAANNNQKVPFASKMDGYPTECFGRDDPERPTVDLDVDRNMLQPPMMLPKFVEETHDGVKFKVAHLTGASDSVERYLQEKFVGAHNFCINAVGPYPSKPYGKQMGTQKGAVAAVMFDSCMPMLTTYINQCTNYFAFRSRPNSEDPKTKEAYQSSVETCLTAQEEGTELPSDFDNCKLGLSEYEMRQLAVMSCASNAHAAAQSESGASHDKIIIGSDMCAQNQFALAALEQQEEADFAASLRGMREATGCFKDYQNEMIQAGLEDGKRNVSAPSEQGPRKATVQKISTPLDQNDGYKARKPLPKAIAQ